MLFEELDKERITEVNPTAYCEGEGTDILDCGALPYSAFVYWLICACHTPPHCTANTNIRISACVSPCTAVHRWEDYLWKSSCPVLYSLCCPQHPPAPEYSSGILQTLQRVLSPNVITVGGNAVALANVICICVREATQSQASLDKIIRLFSSFIWIEWITSGIVSNTLLPTMATRFHCDTW